MSKPDTQNDGRNGSCNHRLNPDTARFVRVEEEGYEVEGICLYCDSRVYDPRKVEDMCSYQQGGF